MVTILFESEPPGAHVARVTDEKDLGAVPFELKLPRAGGKPEYRFHLDGYQDQTLAADLASNLTLKATLEKMPAPPPPAPAAEPPPAVPAAAHVETSHRPARDGTTSIPRPVLRRAGLATHEGLREAGKPSESSLATLPLARPALSLTLPRRQEEGPEYSYSSSMAGMLGIPTSG